MARRDIGAQCAIRRYRKSQFNDFIGCSLISSEIVTSSYILLLVVLLCPSGDQHNVSDEFRQTNRTCQAVQHYLWNMYSNFSTRNWNAPPDLASGYILNIHLRLIKFRMTEQTKDVVLWRPCRLQETVVPSSTSSLVSCSCHHCVSGQWWIMFGFCGAYPHKKFKTTVNVSEDLIS